MSKNLVPILIVFVVIFVGGLGVFLVMNQKQTTTGINTNSTNNSFAPITATSSQSSPTSVPTIIKIQTFPDGLKIEDEKVGIGDEVKSGDIISINYLGTLTNGEKFDSSYDRGQPFQTQIGVGQVIKGWDEGVIGMKAGGKRRLTIPANLGYGSQAQGSIPANSILIFEVELMEIK